MGRLSRDKGANWEREVARILRALWPKARRNGQDQAFAKSDRCDVEETPWWIEAKRYKRCNIQAAYRQAMADTDGRPALVISKDDRAEPLVTLSLESFLRWVKTDAS